MKIMEKLYRTRKAHVHIKKAFHQVRLIDKEAWIPIYECLEKVEARCNDLEDELKKSKGICRKVG
jgi:hypothetical protein